MIQTISLTPGMSRDKHNIIKYVLFKEKNLYCVKLAFFLEIFVILYAIFTG